MKKKYYVNIGSREISQTKYDNNDEFVIYATEDEVRLLRQRMAGMYASDFNAFLRSHVPIMPYHNDKPNDDYDTGITDAFQLIYELGDKETKAHIDSIGVLGDNRM